MNLLITSNAVKDRTSIETNVEATRLRSSILKAQSIGLTNILGSALLTFFTSKVQTDGSLVGLNAIQQECYDLYIVPYLCAETEAEFTVSNTFQSSNVGLNQIQGDKIEPVSIEGIKFYRGILKNDADTYAQRLRDFITCNERVAQDEIYRLYYSDRQDQQPSTKKVTQSQLYTGPRK